MADDITDLFSTVSVRSRFFLGPIAGFSGSAMRRLCIAFGAGLVFTEMVKADHILAGGDFTRNLLKHRADEHPIFAQMLAGNEDEAADAAWALEGQGFDGVELNASCPIRRIVGKGLGSALLRDLDLLGDVVSAMVRAVGLPVTVKLRSGPKSAPVNAHEAARVCEDAGAVAVGIHARSASTPYSAPSDWSVIGAVKEAVSIPVFGSGDVFCAGDAVRMLRETGCDAVLIARGALGNPWIFKQAIELSSGRAESALAKPEAAEVLRVMRQHYEMLVEQEGREQANLAFRSAGGEYCRHLADGDVLRARLQCAEGDEDLTELLEGE